MGGRSSVNARFVCAIPSWAMAAGANRPTIKIMTGFRFDAGSAICAGRRSLSCRLSLRPTATTAHRPQPVAATLLCGTLRLGSCSANSQRPRTRDRSIHSAPMVPKSGFLSATVFVLTLRDACCHSGAGCRQASHFGRPAAALANSIPLFRSVLAFTALKKLSRPPSSPGNAAYILLRLTWIGESPPVDADLEQLKQRLPLL
jgi:hypothetical protein